ncbi:molybdopterin molybdotransferase MoeA [Pseudoflavonifractor sp. DSM 107456]|uniref:Molybdopterin molybdenumtransferase n=1 Tax=Pseudoflavonifractor gallinarum TaxID=2779352 RepID=A0ABR9RBP1_9FIRM|nr:gephyrin-like molybdotransferase Glp [Pseudoflavonifractor gallinarum]MBE5056105.1 molybdopterin molybdotransferase MoeA [Pseudoflavonifractor gallinarum]
MRTRIELEEARALMAESVRPLGVEQVSRQEALGRTLAEDVTAPLDQPPFDRSPLDGYALRSADLTGASPEHPVSLRVVETVYAGGVPSRALGPGEAIRIMTGAMLPRGCDCVLQHERTDNGLEQVQIYAALSPHDNYCDRGEDYRTGEVLLPAGTVVDAAAVGVLASAGLSSVPVRRRPVVRVLSTGDEVVSPDLHPLPAGKIYGSNQELLTARLRELGVTDVEGLLIGDDPREVADTMAQLLGECDLLITTGGVSAGDKDIFHEALPLLGAERVFWKVNLKPGTPAMYSLWQGQPILSLSGNPFAAAATFELLARPLLAALTGESRFSLRSRTAVVEGSFPKASPGRRFLRGFYQEGRVSLTGKNDSGMLASLVGCNCLVDLPAGSPPVQEGQTVTVLLL